MKKSNFSKRIKALALAGSAALLIAGVVVVNGCKKEGTNTQVKQTVVDDESEAMVAHILAFKERMAYYHENPNLKTGGQLYTAPEAIIELENLLNYNFCYTDIQCNKKKFVTSEIIMPLDDLEKINDPKLMEVYYDKVIDTIQAQMGRINYNNMKLLLVDLKVSGIDSNGDAIISVGTLLGNEGTLNIPVLTEDGWIYGYTEGTCSENLGYGSVDAAIHLQEDILFINFPAPPPGTVRRHSNVMTIGPLTPTDYRMENDPLDNLMDYQIFYATNAVSPIIPDTRCLSYDVEMPFYRQQYNLVIDTLEMENNLDFVDCLVEGTTPDGNEYTIQHDFTIHLGHVWYVYVFEIEDILAY